MDDKHRCLSKRLLKIVEIKARKGPRLKWKNKKMQVEKVSRTNNLSKVIDNGKHSFSILRNKMKQNIKKLPLQICTSNQSPDDNEKLIKIEYPTSRCFTFDQMKCIRGILPKRKQDVGISNSPKFIRQANCSENAILKNRNYILTKEGGDPLLIHLRDVLSPTAILGLQFLSFVHAFDIKHNIDLKVSLLFHPNKYIQNQS